MSVFDGATLPAAVAPTYHRQRLILFLLHAAGGSLSKLDLQKLLFLYVQESGKPHYAFVPHKFGCYSFLAKDDIDLLEKRGWLGVEHNHVVLRTPLAGHPWASESAERLEVARWVGKQTLRGDHLIREVYRRFPYYATRSEMKDRLLNADELARVRAAAQSPPREQALYTLGYEGIHFEEYANKLLQNGIRLLCDVRRNPLSRKFGFSAQALATLLPKLGIAYIHLPELGIASEARKNLESDQDRSDLFVGYVRELPKRQDALERVMSLLSEHGRVALTCFEAEAHRCHRHCVSDYLAAHQGVEVVHL